MLKKIYIVILGYVRVIIRIIIGRDIGLTNTEKEDIIMRCIETEEGREALAEALTEEIDNSR